METVKAPVYAITLSDLWFIGIECPKDEDGNDNFSPMSRIVEFVSKYPFPAKVLEAIAPLWFKGRYYSNSYNYRKILNDLDTQPSMYSYAIDKMIEYGILIEVKKRVYA